MEEPEADAHGSDMFASVESEVNATPSSPAVQMPAHVVAEARENVFNYTTRQGKIRRLRPQQ
eukprot:2889556-Amphidinium_carterae.1